MINPVITFHGDSKPLLAALSELRSLLSTGSELEIDGDGLSADLLELLRNGLFESGFDSSKLVHLHCQPSASGANDVLVSFEPSELFRELLSALRAG